MILIIETTEVRNKKEGARTASGVYRARRVNWYIIELCIYVGAPFHFVVFFFLGAYERPTWNGMLDIAGWQESN